MMQPLERDEPAVGEVDTEAVHDELLVLSSAIAAGGHDPNLLVAEHAVPQGDLRASEQDQQPPAVEPGHATVGQPEDAKPDLPQQTAAAVLRPLIVVTQEELESRGPLLGKAAWLVAMSSSGSLQRGQLLDIRPSLRLRNRVGASNTCDFVLDIEGVSREHAEIVYDPRRACYLICDLGSKNGTFLGMTVGNLARVSGEQILPDQAILCFGSKPLFTFRCS